MTIGKKLLAGYGVTLVFLAIIGGVAYRSTLRLVETGHWVELTHHVREEIEQLLSCMRDAETGQRGFIITGKEEYLAPYHKALSGIEERIGLLAALTKDDSNQGRRIEELKPLIAEKLNELKLTVDLRRSKGFDAALQVVNDDRGNGYMNEIRRIVAAMRDDETKLLAIRDADSRQTARITTEVIAVGMPTVCLVTMVGGILIARSLTRPVRELVSATARVGSGKLDEPINCRAGGEIGELATAFNKMVVELRSSVVSAETERSARARVEELLHTIREATTRLSAAAAEITASTSQQAAGAQEQAAALSQTVTTIDEITQTATQAAGRAQGVGEAVRKTVEVGRTGRDAAQGAVNVLESLKGRVESTAEDILALAEQAQAIGEIIATVDDIAEQTNLLALNAAIEASRAGEHGRGFAVVAAEVKSLADQSRKATVQVRQILGEIQRATNAAVLSTEEVTRGVDTALGAGGQAGASIAALAETLNTAEQAANQIVASSGQQATGMAQINQAMRSLDQVARQNLIATRQVEQAARNIDDLGTKLASMLAA
jgi:methyl-accepting chemotaxis protein